MIIADTLIKMICDDLKFEDKHNDIEYVMMNSKLQADKEIHKRNRKMKKNKKEDKEEKKFKSKFANKYSERIKSIKTADEKAIKRKKVKSSKEVKNEEDRKKIEQMIKKQEEMMKKYNKEKRIKPKDYDEVRKEKINKFNQM